MTPTRVKISISGLHSLWCVHHGCRLSMSHLGQTTKGPSAGALGMPLFLQEQSGTSVPKNTCSDKEHCSKSEQMTASLLWTFLASHMYPGVVLVFWVPSRILSLPFTKVNHDYQVHSMHLEQVSEVLCSWESEWALWGLFLLVPACSWGTRASPC